MLFATFDFLSYSDTRYISRGVIISISVIFLQGQILCIIGPVRRTQHRRTHFRFFSFRFQNLLHICLDDGLVQCLDWI
jgi:hypothetical protein